MATIQLWRNPPGTSVSAVLPSGELLAVCDLDPNRTDSEMVLDVFDQVLARARLPRQPMGSKQRGVLMRVALYNPHTFEISVDELPDTHVYGDGYPVGLLETGTVALLSDDRLTLQLGDRAVPMVEVDTETVLAALAGHPTQ